MKVNILDKLKLQSPFHEREQLRAQFGALAIRYGDTLPDGGHMAAKLEFQNEATLRAVARVIREVGRQDLIADDLERRVKLLPPKVEHEPDAGAFDRLVVHEEEARQIRGTLEDLAGDMYHSIDDQTVAVAKVLDAGAFKRNEVPHDLTEADIDFYRPNASYHEQEVRAIEERQMQRQADNIVL